MRTHVTRTVSACFAVLRQLRSIRRSVSRPVLQSLVSSLVLSRLDFGNSTLVDISAHLLSAAPIGDECSGSADFSVVEIRPRHSCSSSTPLAEGSWTDWLQTRRPRIQMPAWVGTAVPHRRTLPSRSPLLVSGTICHSTSLLRLLFTSLHLGWKPTSSPFPFQNSFECTVPVKWLRQY